MSIPVERIREVIAELAYKRTREDINESKSDLSANRSWHGGKSAAFSEAISLLQKVVNEIETHHTRNPTEPERDDQRQQEQQVRVREHKADCYSNNCMGCK